MASGSSYMLQGGDLAAHVGQRVEITGTIAPATGSSGNRSSSSSVGTTGSASSSASSMPSETLHVTSVRMISATCQ